jgi:chemotaxis methyl-accepting protein methylase
MMFRFEGRDLTLLEPTFRELAATGPGRDLSVLCVPCSTGKEAYSYAILGLRAGLPIRVTGVDRQKAYVERAKTGRLIYHWRDREFEDAERFLTVEGPRLAKVRPEVLARCAFEPGDVVLGKLPAGPFDLVACRNLLGYFRSVPLVRALENLDSRVRKGGVLLLDPFVLESPGLADAPRWLREHGYSRMDPEASFLRKA